jgi:putative PIN family toxin of toxin-antitoxin system
LRLVLDTNVLIAAFVARGVCHELLEHCRREHEVVASAFILDEFRNKLRGKFGIRAKEADQAARLLKSAFEWVKPPALPEPACRDPDDDAILATALAGNCKAIVTGDKDLLILDPWRDLRILAPRDFWAFEAGS